MLNEWLYECCMNGVSMSPYMYKTKIKILYGKKSLCECVSAKYRVFRIRKFLVCFSLNMVFDSLLQSSAVL